VPKPGAIQRIGGAGIGGSAPDTAKVTGALNLSYENGIDGK
jgi:hypothetical protein